LHTSASSPVNWTFVALSLLMLAILQSVYCSCTQPEYSSASPISPRA
jgi:hypothetical protein